MEGRLLLYQLLITVCLESTLKEIGGDTESFSAVEAMKSVVLPRLIEDPEILADAVHTWHIEGWTELSRKEHGPVFEAGGNPWCVQLPTDMLSRC